MRKLFLIIIGSIVLWSGENENVRELVEKASKLEQQGDYRQAAELYKQALGHFLPTSLEEKLASESDIETSRERVIQEVVEDIPDPESRKSALQMITSDFGLKTHQENYFLPLTYDSHDHDDRKQTESMLQVSLKYPFASNWLGWDEVWNLAYTQESWWQTFASSKPFRESNYRPELFVEIPLQWGRIRAAELGFLHESNGQDGLESRSWNRFYASAYYQMGPLYLKPRVWYRVPEKDKTSLLDAKGDDNPDIQSYYGYGDLTLGYIQAGHNLTATWRNNLRGDHNRGALELHWSFPFPWVESDNVYGFVYGFTGYGESLIDYDRSVDKVGFGLAFSR